MLISKTFSYLLLVVLLGSIVLIWQMVPLPCETPLLYSLGRFDSQFGLKEVDFLREAEKAESLWEQAAGRELFRYTPEAPFRVNLIFDERQEQTVEGQRLEASFEKTQAKQDTLEQKQQKTLALYETKGQAYERAVSSFKRRLDAYNAEVEKWNREGGAPQEAYEELNRVSRALSQEGEALETKRLELNRLAGEVNAFSKQKVAVVEQYNEQVEQYANRYGEPGEFDQGDYVGTEINIYQYDDLPHLEAVLTHEFGHALGLIHGTNPTSIMYHLMERQSFDPVTLSMEDTALLRAQCSQGVWEVVLRQIGILKGYVFPEK